MGVIGCLGLYVTLVHMYNNRIQRNAAKTIVHSNTVNMYNRGNKTVVIIIILITCFGFIGLWSGNEGIMFDGK